MKKLLTAVFLLPVLYSNAQIGIGTTSPNSTLDVRGALSLNFRVFTGTTTPVSSTDNTIVFTGTLASTATLPDATTCSGRIYRIKNASTTIPTPVLTIATTSSQTIDGLSSWVLDEGYGAITILSNGTNWLISSQSVPKSSGSAWVQGGNSVSAIKKLGTISNFDLPFITNNTEKMRIDVNGNVGIGTASPTAALHVVKSNSGGDVLNLQNTSVTGYSSVDFYSSGNVLSGTFGYGNGSTNAPFTGRDYFNTYGNDFIIANGIASPFFIQGSTNNVGIGTTSPTAVLHLVAGTATASTAPLKFTAGTKLTTAEAGAMEFDGVNTYITNETTSGRGAIPVEQHFLLPAAGSTISTIANYYGATSNIPLVSGGYYEIEIDCYFLKTTAGTVTWTFTNSAAPASMSLSYDFSAASGIVSAPAATNLTGDQYNLTATAPTVVSASLTSAVNHHAHFRIILLNGTGTSLKIQATCSAGTITPGIGSRWYSKRIATSNVGAFAN